MGFYYLQFLSIDFVFFAQSRKLSLGIIIILIFTFLLFKNVINFNSLTPNQLLFLTNQLICLTNQLLFDPLISFFLSLILFKLPLISFDYP